jgi:hypothetical protein
VFEGVHWSASDTCLSQVNAIGRCGIPTLVGRSLCDMDEYEDLVNLKERLRSLSSCPCPRTFKVLDMMIHSPTKNVQDESNETSSSSGGDSSIGGGGDSHSSGGVISSLLTSAAVVGTACLAAGSFMAFKHVDKLFMKH